MTIKAFQTKSNYVKDIMKLNRHLLFNKEMKFIFLIFITILLCHILNLLNYIDLYPFLFKVAVISNGAILLLFLIKDFIKYQKFKKSLKSNLTSFHEGEVNIFFNKQTILVTNQSDEKYLNINWSSINKILV